ncbi:transcriptional regulator [Mesorhizobium sp. WSM3864]|uniref:helix-turn-helix transcriptional regulator n=1 Tax=Mesorhizobium sp. WSM3864 TaxID=2029404 RepID=UPI000BAFD329|nr:helix-turn-helix transcriptional regulator [Mesorhizobium sp. WSM3864]PBB89543.1 transcriptional regulator [Mesorhizobium sp. WSM3864]
MRRPRKVKGLSQEAFADDVGIHRTLVNDLERSRRNSTITIVDKAAAFLDV